MRACAAKEAEANGHRIWVLVEKNGGCSGFQVVISWLTGRMEFRVFLLVSPGRPGILGILDRPLFCWLLYSVVWTIGAPCKETCTRRRVKCVNGEKRRWLR